MVPPWLILSAGGNRSGHQVVTTVNRPQSVDERLTDPYISRFNPREGCFGHRNRARQTDRPRLVRRVCREVFGGPSRAAARRLRSRGGGEPPRRPGARRRRRRVSVGRRAGAHLHARLLPAGRRRSGRLRGDRRDECAQRRVRNGRNSVAGPLDCCVSRRAADRDARGDLRRCGRAGARCRRSAGRGPHDSRRGAQVRPRGRRHGASRRNLAEERRTPRRRALPDQAARYRTDHDRLQAGQGGRHAARACHSLDAHVEQGCGRGAAPARAQRSHRRHRLRAVRARSRGRGPKRRLHPPRVGAVPGHRRRPGRRAQGRADERRSSQPRLRWQRT